MTATLLLLIAGAAPPAETPGTIYKRLRAEFFDETIRKGGAVNPAVVELYAARFFVHAERYKDDASAVEAMLLMRNLSYDKTVTRRKAEEKLGVLAKGAGLSRSLLWTLGRNEGDLNRQFLRDVGERHPDKRVRVLAWRGMVQGTDQLLRDFRAAHPEPYLVALEGDADKNNRERAARLRAGFAAYEKERAEARDKLKSQEFFGVLPDVSVGQRAPATRAVDLAGEAVSLADHKGKVVVLCFWFTYGATSRRTIPATNALAKEMQGRPFAPVWVSIDLKKEAAAAFGKRVPMAGASWWVGYGSPVLDDWDVESYPTAYVIDHEGVIRHRRVDYDPKDDKIPDLVRDLVRKAEAAKRRAP